MRTLPKTAHGGMVVSQEALATRTGVEVFREGGNAVYAAVTVRFTLAVTLPRAGNLGDGGFMVIHLSGAGASIALDYREKAPLSDHQDMFLDEAGNADPNRSRNSYPSVGVPGSVKGWALALKKYDSISLQRALKPAIRLAEGGFPVTPDLHRTLLAVAPDLRQSEAARRVFFKADSSALAKPAISSSIRISR